MLFSRDHSTALVQSPNYPNSYACVFPVPSGSFQPTLPYSCSYVVEARPGWLLTMELADFELAAGLDYVELHSRAINASLKGNQLVARQVESK